MTEKRFTIEILDDNNWLIEDTETGFDYNPVDGTSRVLKGFVDLVNNLYKENEQLKQSQSEAIELILDGVVEMHDGKREYAEIIFNKAIKVIKNDP